MKRRRGRTTRRLDWWDLPASPLSLLFGVAALTGTRSDAPAQTTTRVSVDSLGAQASRESSEPSLAADGRCVVFASEASKLVPGDTNFLSDIVVYDRKRREIARVHLGANGA